MSDVTQGDHAQTDEQLFSEATNAETLSAFENATPQPEPKPPEPPPAPEPPKSDAPKPPAPEPDTGPVPPGRLREEAEARRRAERERDELQRQIVAMSRSQQPPPQPQQRPTPVDMFENPQGFIQQEVAPYLEQLRNDFQNQREAMSLNYAIDRHSMETVSAARHALEQGMQRGDQGAWGTYNRAMQSHDPYGVIVRAHLESEQLREIGGDLAAYRKRVLEEALADPEYRKRAVEAARSQANGGVYRPAGQAPSAQAPSPSLGDIGASGGEAAPVEPSDIDLFRAATRAKRR